MFPLECRRREWRTLITCAFYVPLLFSVCLQYIRSLCNSKSCRVIQFAAIQTPHSVIVTVLTGSSDCLVIQLKHCGPKKPQHISIILLTKCKDGMLPGIRAPCYLHVYYLGKPRLLTWVKESQFEALVHTQHPPATHTPESQLKKKKRKAKHFGRQEVV